MNLMRKLAEEGNNPAAANNPQRTQSRNGYNEDRPVSSSTSSNRTSLDNGTEYASPLKDE